MAARCQECGKLFGGVTPFDKHRIGAFEVRDATGTRLVPSTRRCMTEDEMRAIGLGKLSYGFWGQPAYPKGVTTLCEA